MSRPGGSAWRRARALPWLLLTAAVLATFGAGAVYAPDRHAADRAIEAVGHDRALRDRVGEMDGVVGDADAAVRSYVVGGNPDDLGAYASHVTAVFELLHEAAALARSIDPGLLSDVQELESTVRVTLAGYADALRLARDGRSGEAATLLAGGPASTLSPVRAATGRFVEAADARAVEHEQEASAALREASIALVLACTAAVAALVALVVIVARARRAGAARKRLIDDLRRVATHDALTGLPNRLVLDDRLEHAIERSLRRGVDAALVFLDLDGFKAVNDTHGHQRGDELLVAIAEGLEGAVREGDTLARVGGDEFVVLIEDLALADDVDHVLRRLSAAVDEASAGFVALNGPPTVGVSAGSARLRDLLNVDARRDARGRDMPRPSTDRLARELLRRADAAMYRAKPRGAWRGQRGAGAPEAQPQP